MNEPNVPLAYEMDFNIVNFTSKILSNDDESLNDETCLLLLWVGLLVTLHTFCSSI